MTFEFNDDVIFDEEEEDENKEKADCFTDDEEMEFELCLSDDENFKNCESESDAEDDEAEELRKKIKRLKEFIQDEKIALSADKEDDDIGDNNGKGFEVADVFEDETYEDSSDADSPSDESDIGNDKHERSCIKKKLKYAKYNPKYPMNLQAGMLFCDKKECKKAVENYRILSGYHLKVQKSDKNRMQLCCLGEGCEWRFWASKVGKELSFQIKTIDKPHTCIPFSFEPGKRHMSVTWMAEEYTKRFRQQPSLRARELQKIVQDEHNFNATLSMCARARRKALASIIGDYKDEFQQLRDYVWEVYKKNPNTSAMIKTTRVEEPNKPDSYVFQFLYLCPGSLKAGFVVGCRRVVSLDACFIKGPWDGQVFVAIGRDANDQMYPIAWGVGKSERKELWDWFVSKLSQDLGMEDGEGWTIISDQQKGLVECVLQVLPKAEHRLCARHVYANLRKIYKGEMYKKIFWRIAKSTNEVHLNHNSKEMKEVDASALEFLEKKGIKHFCRAYFKTEAKCDSVDNNMAEIFNAFIMSARYMPIVSMLKTIYKLVMKRIAEKNIWALKLDTHIAPRIRMKLDKKIDKARFWEVTRAGNGFYSVASASREYVVNLNERTCSCKSWMLCGIPCSHSIAVMREERLNPDRFVHSYYECENLKRTYAHTLVPINGPDMWEKAPGSIIVAPYFKPKKKTTTKYLRRPEAGEKRGRASGVPKVKKNGVRQHCSICGDEDHNKATCRQNVTKLKVKRPKIKRGNIIGASGSKLQEGCN